MYALTDFEIDAQAKMELRRLQAGYAGKLEQLQQALKLARDRVTKLEAEVNHVQGLKEHVDALLTGGKVLPSPPPPKRIYSRPVYRPKSDAIEAQVREVKSSKSDTDGTIEAIPQQPPYDGMSRVSAIYSILESRPDLSVSTDIIVAELYGEIPDPEIKARMDHLTKTSLRRGVHVGKWYVAGDNYYTINPQLQKKSKRSRRKRKS